ncbi:MAG TPA: radical SAM protein [Sedimentisphaerales bacterium]|nr:radical SAM protein [Sedimentisphaerales bacterium]
MAACKKCGRVSAEIAEVLSLCGQCVRKADNASLTELQTIHAQSREKFGLPSVPPSGANGIQCDLCQNKCEVPIGGDGYCGVRSNENGRLIGGGPRDAVVSWYYDPLPTNCVADWVCPGGSGAGYPKWAHVPRAEHGYVNLAVFYEACSFNCLFCQNWHFREFTRRPCGARSIKYRTRTAQELAESVTKNTSCICFFGGDPTCQLPHALAASRLARRQSRPRILRICWETNGSMSAKLLDKMLSLSLESGGCVKFDLKAMDRNIHYALCGVDNRRTFENFAAAAARRIPRRPEPPPLIASTLLVPGYIDANEVGAIASFIARLNPDIPYALLGFHGDFLMTDLPPTSWKQAESCLAAAEAAGLKRVRLGNVHVLR